MKLLITGAKGFIGKNLISELKNIKEGKINSVSLKSDLLIYEYDIDTSLTLLDSFCRDADFVFHLAGINRPNDQSEYMEGNFGFTSLLLDTLKKYQNRCPIMLASSTQAELNNPYGNSKKAGEDLFFEYSQQTGSEVLVYRFPNVFGKWCRPNYNSAIATFCYNIARNLPIHINNRSSNLTLVYIDDVVNELILALQNSANKNGLFCKVPIEYQITLGEIVDLIYTFKESRANLLLSDFSDNLTKNLYSTYLSYLPEDKFSYPLKMNIDKRGSFTEFIKSQNQGQISINIIKPGITKGEHWHHTKVEKFLVVSGKGVIRLRKIDNDSVFEYYVSGDMLEVVDIPVGYTHNIENLGQSDMVTVMWVNEPFDIKRPDTYFLPVNENH